MQARGMVVLLERLIFERRTLEILATRENDDLFLPRAKVHRFDPSKGRGPSK